MDDRFDPYHKWLGIPPEEQPPNYYRLLGVALWEADLDVISNASDQRMTHLRTFATGKHAALSQRVLNEIAAAKVCLLNPAKKAEYDRALIEQHMTPGHIPPPPPPLPASQFPPPQRTAQRPQVRPATPAAMPEAPPDELFGIGGSINFLSTARKRRKQSSWLGPVVVLLCMTAALGVGAGLYFRNQNTAATTTPKNNTPKSNGKLPPRVGSKTGDARVTPAKSVDTPEDKPGDSPQQPAQNTSRPDPNAPIASPQTVGRLIEMTKAAIDAGNVVESDAAGVATGTSFEDIIAGGGLLVGLKVSIDATDSAQRITAVQPVFETSQGTLLGKVHGQPTGPLVDLRGKSGWFVAGLNVSGDEYVAGLELILMPVAKQGLDAKRATKSQWVGGRPPEAATTKLAGTGQAVLGIFGSVDGSLMRLGLITEAYAPDDLPGVGDSATDDDSPPMTDEQPSPAFVEKPGAEKLPIPTGAPLKKARDSVRELFRQDYTDAKTAAQKFALAEKLFSQAKSTKDDPVAQYALLDEARQLAAQVGESEAAIQAIIGMASLYQVDDVGLTVAALVEAEKAPTLGPIKKKLAENALKLVDKAVDRERFDVADKLAGVASRAASKAGDGLLVEQAKSRAASLKTQAKAFAALQAASETLQTTPDDAEANLAVGKYRCMVRDDWPGGLPLLVKGTDTLLKKAAELELKPPADGAEMADLGDLWAAIAQSDPNLRAACQKHARLWYKRAATQLSGLAKAKVDKALEELSAGHGLKAEFFAGAGKFDNKLKTRIDPNIDFEWGQRDPDPDVSLPAFTVRWSGWISAPTKGTYKLVIDRDNGARVLLDGKLAIDGWSQGGRSELTLPLSRKPKAITVEYFDNGRPARAILKWSQVGGFEEQVVPTEALFHNFTAAQKGYGQE